MRASGQTLRSCKTLRKTGGVTHRLASITHGHNELEALRGPSNGNGNARIL